MSPTGLLFWGAGTNINFVIAEDVWAPSRKVHKWSRWHCGIHRFVRIEDLDHEVENGHSTSTENL